MTVPERALFWLTMLASSLIMAYSVQAAVMATAPKLHPFARDAITILVFTPLFAPMPTLVTRLATDASSEAVLPFSETYLMVLVATSSAATIRHIIGINARSEKEESDPRPRFLRRLSDEITPEQVLRLTVDDHYVELYLTNGESHRVLIRFSDAVEEMDGLEGMCVHRSHWVAVQAIRRVERCGGREFVVLGDDSRVPVSRTYRPNLVEAGWIVDRRQRSAG